MKQGKSSDFKTDAANSASESVADILGMEKGGGDAFLEIGSSVPMGTAQGWEVNEWVMLIYLLYLFLMDYYDILQFYLFAGPYPERIYQGAQ